MGGTTGEEPVASVHGVDLQEPVVIEGFGTPDLFANGAVLRDDGDVFTLVYFVTRRAGEAVEHHEVLRVRIPRSDFMKFRVVAQRYLARGAH